VRFEVSRDRNKLASDSGSGIVGFVLVAPLLVSVFIAIAQIAMLVADKSVLDSAAAIGARTASAADATNEQGRSAVLNVLASRGSGFKPEKIIIKQVSNHGFKFVSVSVTRVVEIPFVGHRIFMTGEARAIDEAFL
jgi:hypothetical protein